MILRIGPDDGQTVGEMDQTCGQRALRQPARGGRWPGLRFPVPRARVALSAAWLALTLAGICFLPALAAPMPEKDETRILPDSETSEKDQESLLPPLGGEEEEGTGESEYPPQQGEQVDEDVETTLETLIEEDIPELEVVQLDVETAKRALDAFAEVFGKFSDEEIAKYPTLQEFAEKSPQGKKFAEIIRRHGFRSVREWNNVITNIGFAFSSIEEGHDDEILRQIVALERREDLPPERKERLLKYLHALIPSIGNRKVVLQLLKDPEYRKKLGLLEGEAEAEEEEGHDHGAGGEEGEDDHDAGTGAGEEPDAAPSAPPASPAPPVPPAPSPNTDER